MNPDETALWTRLRGFRFSDDTAALSFARRLAREQGWSPEFTRRVLEEYRRFLFLAVTAGHPVTPGDAVDQAWHLHLIYTRSYWEDLCGRVLRQPLHHGATLASYRRQFGEPPADLWPAPAERFARPGRFVRVDRSRWWLLPRPGWRWALLPGATAVAGCVPVSWLMHRSGGEFLPWYAACVAGALALGWFLRRRTTPGFVPGGPVPADPLDIALLGGGRGAAIRGVAANLVQRSWAAVTVQGGLEARTLPAAATGLTPWETAARQLLVTARRPVSLARLGSALRPELARGEVRLTQAGLLARRGDLWRRRLLIWLPGLAVLALGAARTVQGLIGGWPVGCLTLLNGALFVGLLCLVPRGAQRTGAGLAALRELRRRHGTAPAAGPPTGAVPDLADALPVVGLFGLGALAGTLYGAETERLRRAAATQSDGAYWYSGNDSGGDNAGSDGGDGSSGCGGCGGGD
jgi:uncharacterized protein (TIGR04222 family)